MAIPILDGGEAEHLGDGTIALMQKDEYGVAQCVIVEEADLLAIIADISGTAGR